MEYKHTSCYYIDITSNNKNNGYDEPSWNEPCPKSKKKSKCTTGYYDFGSQYNLS